MIDEFKASKDFIDKKDAYRPVGCNGRSAVPTNASESVNRYMNNRSINAIEERAKAFYADFKVPKAVESANREIASKLARAKYKI